MGGIHLYFIGFEDIGRDLEGELDSIYLPYNKCSDRIHYVADTC